VWSSFDPARTGWSIVGGTSEACPLFAGVVAMADQRAGHRIGTLGSKLYRLAVTPRSGVIDITRGDTTFAGVTGYRASRGYDLASGWGTINAATLVARLSL
jgi:subtilase family serine protease